MGQSTGRVAVVRREAPTAITRMTTTLVAAAATTTTTVAFQGPIPTGTFRSRTTVGRIIGRVPDRGRSAMGGGPITIAGRAVSRGEAFSNGFFAVPSLLPCLKPFTNLLFLIKTVRFAFFVGSSHDV